MPARSCIGALIAALALLAPPAALAQSGGGGGAGDSQYQDPFGSSTNPSRPKAKPKAPAAQQAPAQQQQTSPVQPTPDHTAPAPAATAPAPTAPAAQGAQGQAAQAQDPGGQTLPRTGFDVLPVAAIGLVLLLGGLALWRRPHAGR
jgi:LPXTG-motif cell wall-anchored protein